MILILLHHFVFPVFAILPKFYLFGIVDPGYGYWVSRYLSRQNQTAISAIDFHIWQEELSWFIHFGLPGVMMKACGLLLDNVHTVIGFVLFIAIMSLLVMFDTVVYGTFIDLIRFGLLLPPILWLILRK
jgi:hypothetical protein